MFVLGNAKAGSFLTHDSKWVFLDFSSQCFSKSFCSVDLRIRTQDNKLFYTPAGYDIGLANILRENL
jgi:hypothetical protein